MKKIFTLIAAAFLAASVNAQTILFPDLQEIYSAESGFKVTRVDPENKHVVDDNNTYFGTETDYFKIEKRMKTNGKSTSTKNFFTLTIPSDGKLSIYARTGSNSATDRNLIISQDGTELFNKVLLESEAVEVAMDETDPTKKNKVYPIITVDVKAGTVNATYPIGSVNFYGFVFEGTTAINNVNAAPSVKTAKTIENGQLVIKSAKGTFNAAGAQMK